MFNLSAGPRSTYNSANGSASNIQDNAGEITGVDFAGPFIIRKGYTRKPVKIKSYACLFVCFTTKAVHIELAADLTTEGFMACIRRFCARRGKPAEIHSDNGTNFVGSHHELQEIQCLLTSTKSSISHFCGDNAIKWHFIPPRTPQFGGLWEAEVRSMKQLLRKHVSTQLLQFDELETLLTEIESILNSCRLCPTESTDPEVATLTPAHCLIGRSLVAPPDKAPSNQNVTFLRRWQLVQHLTQDLWRVWRQSYLSSLQSRNKWRRKAHTLKVGDVVYLKETLA